MIRKEANSPEYIKWRRAVYKRDKRRCVCCKKRRKLQAHHLNGWSWAFSQRYDVNNGVSLCYTHHTEFHKLYGKKNCSREQFDTYLRNNFHKTLNEVLNVNK